MPDTHPPVQPTYQSPYSRNARSEEYTPANSINEAPLRVSHRGRLWLWVDGKGKVVLRMTNAMLHLALCFVLLAIMVEFMVRYRGHRRRPQAIALITIAALDSCLDIYSIYRLKRKCQGLVMALRLLLAMGYIAQFMVYVGFRRVFPSHYTYWRMAEGYSEPIVYLLLVIIGIWNLIHTALHRHALGRDLYVYVAWIQAHDRRSGQIDGGIHRNQGRVAFRSQQQTTTTRPTMTTPRHVEELSDSSVTIALSEVQSKDKCTGTVVTNQIGSSSTFGESSSHGGSTVHTRSEAGGAVTSSRTSATMSDVEISHAHGLANQSSERRGQS